MKHDNWVTRRYGEGPTFNSGRWARDLLAFVVLFVLVAVLAGCRP